MFGRPTVVIMLSLLPCPAVWFGMYHLNSLLWTFFLYHGICLLPAAIWGRRLWQSHLLKPTGRQWLVVLAATVASSALAIAAYSYTQGMIVSDAEVMSVLTERGFRATDLIPLSIYFVVVNSCLEELFWRGVVLNELEYLSVRWQKIGALWTAFTFGIWHYLILKPLLHPGWAELAVVGVIAMGMFSSWIYRRTQSIILPIIWHALVFDLAIMAIFGVLVLRS